jgi:hypothetical protein
MVIMLTKRVIFWHDHNNTDNYRLCPFWGVHDGFLITDSPCGDTSYTIAKDGPQVWGSVKLTQGLYDCATYAYSHYPKVGSWVQHEVLKPSVKVFAQNKKGDAAMWVNRGCDTNPLLLSMYVSQMLEFSENNNDLQLLYNLIVWLAAQKLPPWSPEAHNQFPTEMKRVVLTLLLMAQRDPSGVPYHSESLWYKVPKEVIYEILNYAFSSWTY